MSDLPDIKSALNALKASQEDGLSPWHRVAVLLVSVSSLIVKLKESLPFSEPEV